MLLFHGKVNVTKPITYVPNKYPYLVAPLELGEWVVKIEVNRAFTEWGETATLPKETLIWKELGDASATQMSFGLVLSPGTYRVRTATNPVNSNVVRIVWERKK